jgi:peptidyl-tRNA hydrolase
MNPTLELTAGKAMAQVGHAAQLGLAALDDPTARKWAGDGFPLAVRVAGRADWDRLLRRDLPVVRDAGFTEVAPGTCTAVAEILRA